MKPVFQTRYGKDEGNCYQACLASIMEMELDEVPDFCNLYPERGHWQLEANIWLRQFGLATVTIAPQFGDDYITAYLKDCFLIATGDNSNGVRHCVIWKNGITVHNPNKDCKGINPDSIDLVFPCELERRNYE